MSKLNKHNPLSKAVKYALLAASAATAYTAPAVFAAEEEAGKEQKITVLGSRIQRQDAETAAPVQIITREQIEATGLLNIGDILQNVPSAGSALNRVFNNGGDGSVRIDLRNLGSNRVLVLVNGRRWNPGIGGSVDLQNIPSSIVERIEILKDGASAIYGSDAIAGVINITTRSDYQGMEARAYAGAYDEGDGEQESYDFSIGMTGEKGSAFLSASYTQQSAVYAGDRPISAVPVFGTPDGFYGSSGTPLGRFLYYTPGFAGFANDTLDGVNGGFSAWDNVASRYNYAPENYLETPNERINVFAQASYELSDNVNFTTEIFYSNRKSDQLLAPTPLFFGYFFGGISGQITIGDQNPYNPLGYSLDSSCSDAASGCLLLLGRRQIEAGHRNFAADVDQYQFSAGLDGVIELGEQLLQWDFNYTYATIQNNEVTEGLLNMQRVQYALSNACVTDATCVPYNVFGGSNGVVGDLAGGSITQEMIDYVSFTAQDSSGTEMRDYTFNITGELFELPGGIAGFAAGLAKGTRSGYDQPDALIAAGITSGNSRLPTSGTYSVQEAYVEFAFPIIDDLELTLATRYSDYDNFGDTTNSKIGLKYDIMDGLSVRGTWSQAFRAPSVFELFQGRGDSYPNLTDPCNNGGTTAIEIANCASEGVPLTYAQANGQIRISVGGNPDLGPENSEATTFGIIYSPSFVDGLDITMDWYEFNITDAVSSVGAQNILNECYSTAERGLCDFVERGGSGAVLDLYNGNVNLDELVVRGADMSVAYRMETGFGSFSFVWDSSYNETYHTVTEDGTEFNLLGNTLGGTPLPKVRSNFSTTWSMDDLTVNWNMRYIHHTTEACFVAGFFDDRQLCSDEENGENKLASTVYHDMRVAYNLADYNTSVSFGVRNAFDKQPAVSYSAFANSFAPTLYQVPGVQWYAQIKHEF
ncbi:MAG: iron complex outermembrane receptor protein [Polaribacter sp.]